MLKGSNTSISIAHRLSTIQRSDQLIVIGGDGRIAQTGTYKQLAADKEGAFARLMEWQMSGGATALKQERDVDPELTEEERMKLRLREHDERGEKEGDDGGGGEQQVEEGEKVGVEQKR